MTRSKFYSICMMLLILLMVVISCKDDENPPDEPIFKIGAVIPLTGAASSTGISTQAAIELAVSDINDYLTDLGSGKIINVKVEDSETDTAVALQKVSELFGEGMMTIVGPYSSASVAAVRNFADENGAIIVSPSSVATSLAKSGDNIYRMVPADFSQGEAMAALLGDDNVDYIIPIVRDDLWGNELIETTSDHFLDLSGGVTSHVAYYPPDETDFSQYIPQMESRVQEALMQYDTSEIGIYMVSFGEGTAILNAARDNPTLKHLKWYGGSAFADNASLPSNATAAPFALSRNLLCPIFGYDPSAKSKWEPLIERIEAKIGRKPEIYALCAYDALWLISLSYLATGYPAEIQNFKIIFERQADDFFGVTGWTSLNSAGDRDYAVYDFYGIMNESNNYAWHIGARYNNATKELTRY